MRILLSDRTVDALIARARRDPYFHLPGYMERYWLLRPRWWLPISIRIHHILRSDDDLHLHDHPWPWASLILRGSYIEVEPTRARFVKKKLPLAHYRPTGSFRVRRARAQHRLIVRRGATVWSLFIMGPRIQKWGFYTPLGKVPFDQYLPAEEVAHQRRERARFGIEE